MAPDPFACFSRAFDRIEAVPASGQEHVAVRIDLDMTKADLKRVMVSPHGASVPPGVLNGLVTGDDNIARAVDGHSSDSTLIRCLPKHLPFRRKGGDKLCIVCR